jgi:hypothetical protein
VISTQLITLSNSGTYASQSGILHLLGPAGMLAVVTDATFFFMRRIAPTYSMNSRSGVLLFYVLMCAHSKKCVWHNQCKLLAHVLHCAHAWDAI